MLLAVGSQMVTWEIVNNFSKEVKISIFEVHSTYIKEPQKPNLTGPQNQTEHKHKTQQNINTKPNHIWQARLHHQIVGWPVAEVSPAC